MCDAEIGITTMGYWTTLHLFDEQLFHLETIPALKGQNGKLETYMREYHLRLWRRGKFKPGDPAYEDFLQAEKATIQFVSNQMDAEFRGPAHPEENTMLSDLSWDSYDFLRFFEYLMFRTCADYLPHLMLGKRLANVSLDYPVYSFADIILSKLNWSGKLFRPDTAGIAGWISHEEVQMLTWDLDKMPQQEEEDPFSAGFLAMLEVAYQHGLGLMKAIDIDHSPNIETPPHKLVGPEAWEGKDLESLMIAAHPEI